MAQSRDGGKMIADLLKADGTLIDLIDLYHIILQYFKMSNNH